jgi:hypothetical protein
MVAKISVELDISGALAATYEATWWHNPEEHIIKHLRNKHYRKVLNILSSSSM